MTNKYVEGLTELLQNIGNISAQINSNGEPLVYADCLRDLQRAQIAAIHRTGREYSTPDAMISSALDAVARLSSGEPNFGHALGLANAALILAAHLAPEPAAQETPAEPVRSPELSDEQLRTIVTEVADKLMENRRVEAGLARDYTAERRAREQQADLTRTGPPGVPQTEAGRKLASALEDSLAGVVGAAKGLRPPAPGPATPSAVPPVGAGRLSDR